MRKKKEMTQENATMTQENATMTQENATMTQENATMTQENATMTQENATMTQENATITDLTDTHVGLFLYAVSAQKTVVDHYVMKYERKGATSGFASDLIAKFGTTDRSTAITFLYNGEKVELLKRDGSSRTIKDAVDCFKAALSYHHPLNRKKADTSDLKKCIQYLTQAVNTGIMDDDAESMVQGIIDNLKSDF